MRTHRITAGSTLGGMVEQVSFFLPPGMVMEQEPAPPRVQRQKLLEAFVTQLREDHLMVLCASEGHGAASMAHEVARTFNGHLKPPLYIRCDHMPSHVIREAMASLAELKDSKDAFPFDVVCIEGVRHLDTEDAPLISDYLQQMISKTHVILRLDVASLAVLETVRHYSCLQAYDLLASTEEIQRWFCDSSLRLTLKAMKAMTGGITSLLEGLATDGVWLSKPNDSSVYESMRSMLLYNAVADGLIREDRKLRAAMILLGEGTFDQLRELGVRVDDELARCTYQEAPVLGVDSSFTTFRIVGGPSVPPAVAQRIGEEFPELVQATLHQLMECSKLKQVVSIAHPCRQWLDLRPLAGTMPLELWNANGADILREALYEATTQDQELSKGLLQARTIFQLCAGVIDARSPKLRETIEQSPSPIGSSFACLERSLSLYRQWPKPETGISSIDDEVCEHRSLSESRMRSKTIETTGIQALKDQLERHCLYREQLLLGDWRAAVEARLWALSSKATETVVGSLLVVDAYCACGLLDEGITR